MLCGAWLSRTPATWFVGGGGILITYRSHLDLTERSRTFIPDIHWLTRWWAPVSRIREEWDAREHGIGRNASWSRRMRSGGCTRRRRRGRSDEEDKHAFASLLFQYTNSYKKKKQMSHPPLISRFANDAIVFLGVTSNLWFVVQTGDTPLRDITFNGFTNRVIQ